MSQMTIDLDAESEARIVIAAKSAGLSPSQWVAALIRQFTDTTWPDAAVRALGSWPDAPSVEEIRKGMSEDSPRETL